MALDQSALSELLDAIRAGGEIDVIRTAVQVMLQARIDAEAEEVIGAARYERQRRAYDAPQRQPRAAVVDQGR